MERSAIRLIAVTALTGCASWHPEYDQIRPVAHIEVAGIAKVGTTSRIKIWYMDETLVPEDKILGNISLDEAGRVGWVSVRIRRAAYFGPGFPHIIGCCESLELGLKPSAAGLLRLAAKEPFDGSFDEFGTPRGSTMPPTHDILVNVEP
jgi:hypothetical protein